MKSIYFSLIIGVLLLAGCGNTKTYNDPIPAHETFTIQATELGENRTINVWVPKEYATTEISLPVLYMPDGGIKEDFPHVANTLAKLIANKSIAPIILVGIENTQRRRDLTGKTTVATDMEIAPIVGGSEQFRNFIKNELIVEVTKRYKTTTKKGIIGESLAGLFVTETFFLETNLFDFYIAFDPSLWWNDKTLIKTANTYLETFPKDKKAFWFAGSSAEDINKSTNKLSDILKTRNLESINWNYSNEPKEKHHTIFRATKEKALIWTLNQTVD